MGFLHCLDVGCADASVIITETATFLVDSHNIGYHTYLLPFHRRLRGVFVTHQHDDHFSGLNFLKDNDYNIDYLIFSPYSRRYGDSSVTIEEWNEFNSLKNYFANRGTKLISPYRQADFNSPWWKTGGVRFWMIGPHRSVADRDKREIHDASLVIKADLGKRYCLFTGDASDNSLECITANTTNYCNDILHASHHGSLNGAYLDFIKKSNARYTVISTRSGVYQNVPHPTALRRYREYTQFKVYRTDVDGACRWTF